LSICAIVHLLHAAEQSDYAAIAGNRLSRLFKGKILFLYHPQKFAPIYSEAHLKHFIAALDLSGPFTCGPDMQRALMDYRATWPALLAQSPALYMAFLYEVFSKPAKQNSDTTRDGNEPLLDEAAQGAQFISAMPPLSADAKQNSESERKKDFESLAWRLKRIGDRGEALVAFLERRRLHLAGKPELAERVKHVSQEDDSAGYDILSFDEDGTVRPIEVKATTCPNLDRGFFISRNEVEKATALPNFHIYLVFSTMTEEPRILQMKRPAFDGTQFALRPVGYHATLAGKEIIQQ
jgi:hypothetical protein